MDTALAVLAAIVATGFSLDLWLSYRSRPRAHAVAWAVAMSLFAVATWALVLGLAGGWGDTTFRVFYYLGAIANIPLLALGSVYLVLGDRAGRRSRNVLVVFLATAAWVTMTAVPQAVVADVGIPEGSEVFDMPLNDIEGGVALPSPRLFAAVAGGVGTIAIVSLALWSTRRTWSTNRRIAIGNLFIVAGVAAPATGGSLIALGEGSAFALTLLVGATLLWAGYRVASGRRVLSVT